MRALSGAAAAQFGRGMALAVLTKLSLTQPVCVASCRDTIEWNGDSYLGGRQTAMDPIKDQGGEVVGMRFQISGVPVEYLQLALSEPIQGKVVQVWLALMDAETHAILDVNPLWSGTLDQMPISSGESLTIGVTAEHRGITFARPKGLRYTDGDQQLLAPGDRSLQFIVSQAQHQDVWPAAAYFKG